MKALNGKEWDSECWDGNMWEDSDEPGNIEPLNTHESSSPAEAASPNPVEAASPPQSEEINPELPEQSVMTSLEEMSLKDTADAPQVPLLLPSCFYIYNKTQVSPGLLR